jgi:hypothetical protein
MADNTTLNPGSGGDVIASDDVAGVKYQVVKLDVGGDGASSSVTADNPLPVAESGPLITLFIRMLNMLGAPVGYDKSLQRYRQTSIIETGNLGTISTVTTVSTTTTVGTVTNQANIGGIQAQLLVNAGNLAAWQASVRARIS